MRSIAAHFSFLFFAVNAAAQGAPAPAPAPAPVAAPAPAAAGAPTPAPVDAAVTPPPPEKPDAVKEAFDLVEVQANSRTNLEKAIKLYEANLKDAARQATDRVNGYNDLARAYQRLGDLEKGDDQKIALYTKGRAAAQAALAIDNKSADAWFWDMANQACIGRTKGVMNSLFMLPELRKGLGRALELQPNHKFAKQTLGEIDHSVPGIAGGSDSRAEKAYTEILQRDPRFTPTMVLLAKLYRDQGKDDEAKKWAQKVLDTKSSIPHDWRKFDKAEAQKLLKELED